MIFEYACEVCNNLLEKDYKIGEASEFVYCSCGKKAYRTYSNSGVVFQGSGWPSKTMKTKKQLTANNEAAGKRMEKT